MIKENKERFIQLLRKVKRTGANVEGLIEHLSNTDFFTAPASTKYHFSEEGGLCAHSLDVYDNLVKLTDTFTLTAYDEDSLIIVGLLHEVNKINFYEKYYQNKKVYTDGGKQFDKMGRYNWESIEAWGVREPEDRFLAGTGGENAYLIASAFLPLSHEETVAFLNGGVNIDNTESNWDLGHIISKYDLVMLLKVADFISTYKTNEQNK